MKIEQIIVTLIVVILFLTGVIVTRAPRKTKEDPSSETCAETVEYNSEALVTNEESDVTNEEFDDESVIIGEIEQEIATGLPAPFIEELTDPPTEKQTTTKAQTTTTSAVTNDTHAKSGSDDIDYLAAVIHQEAGSDSISDKTRQYVAEVVLNRVEHKNFPNTILGVLTQYRQYGTYYKTGVPKLSYQTAGAERAYRIAQHVLEGNREVPKNVIYQAEFPQGSGVWAYIDGIYFCYE